MLPLTCFMTQDEYILIWNSFLNSNKLFGLPLKQREDICHKGNNFLTRAMARGGMRLCTFTHVMCNV